MKISKRKLQNYINRLSGNPKLWRKFRNIYHIDNLSDLDFSNLNFSDKDFSYFDFSNMSFYSTNFDSADFHSTSFNSANFIFVNFRYTDFHSTNFHSVNFASARFNSASFDYASFGSANFNHANFDSANFSHVDFYSTDFDFINFDSVKFDHASFDYASFDYVDFYSARFNSVDFYSTSFHHTDFRFANFNHAKFSYRFLRRLVSLRTKMKHLGFLEVDKYYIGFKVFREFHTPDLKWRIKEGSVIRKRYVDDDLYQGCGYGINVANKSWILENTRSSKIWIIAIDRGDKIIVPYESNGKIRVNRCKLLKRVTRKQLQNMSDDDILDLVKENKREGNNMDDETEKREN